MSATLEKKSSNPEDLSRTPSQDATLAPHRSRDDAAHEEELAIGGVTQPLDWEDDPDNPRNWPLTKKWTILGVVSLYTLVAPLASSMLAPGLEDLARHYDITNSTVVALTLSIFLLGFALGPLFYGPMSEIYGRRPILHISTISFLIFNLVSIWAPNTAAIVVFRFFAGLGGSAAVGIGAGCVADVFHERERASAMGIYTLGPLIGPVVGPVAGGFIVASIGFKYVFVVITALTGLSLIVGLPLLRETYAPVIIERKVKKRAAEEAARGEKPEKVPEQPPLAHVLWLNLSRPFILLTRSWICFLLSLYMAITYGIMYLLFTTFPTTFSETYGFGTGVSGLAYLGLGVGFFLSTLVGARVMNTIYLTLTKRNNGVAKPEYRIPLMLVAGILIPIGLFWYGWTARASIHWIVPIIGSSLFGLGTMLSFLGIQLYLVDTFAYAASAISAASFLRSFFGFLFPLFAQRMFDALGTAGGSSLLAGVAIIVGIPFPIYLYYRGEQLRGRSSLTRR
ncbi:MFS general substrate transporter [Exidia glandulosa HHB12029]|uniref:MFS general substrate transporter n=1 Tax=Exidia glandulosa HHB12029 TaxID=1314781 RepID=A0A165HIH6_EXIGL|nr:MFS general substrate transporter [Exidia glandulosa HHB12029]